VSTLAVYLDVHCLFALGIVFVYRIHFYLSLIAVGKECLFYYLYVIAILTRKVVLCKERLFLLV